MAETYKGLTIRIGGDTTRLQSAMKSADSAISSTQTMLNKLTRALKFDGADASGLNRQMDLLANKASESYAAMDRLRKSVEQIKNQKVQLFDGTDSSRSIQRYIDDLKAANDGTVDLAANAAEAREQYNRLNAELEQIYRAINKSAKESEQFEKGFDIRKQIDNLDELESKLLSTGAATEEQIALIRELRPQWQAAFDENQFAQAAAGLDEANNRIEVLKANAKQAANQFAEMSAQMSRVQFVGSLDEQLKQVSVQSDKAAENLSRLQKALDIDPSSYQTFNATSKQISENIELAQRRAVLLRQAIEQLNSRGTAEITDDMRQFANSTEDAEEKLRAAANEVTELRGRLSEARNALRLAEKEADTLPEKFDEASTQVNDLQAQLRKATDNMERMNSVASAFRGSEELSEYNIELRETEALISRLNAQKSSMGSIGGLSLDALMTMGMTLSTTVTPAIIQMGQYAVEAAVDIDAAYRDMRKTVNGTEQDFEALRQAAIDFSTQNVTSADTMLSIQAIGGELGVATDSLKSFSEVVSNLDVATNLNAEEAATQLGQLANIMHMTESDYVSFGDALVRLGNNGASTESQIADIATRIGSMGSIIGMSTPDVLAWASTIASTGQNAEAAGTAISNTMSDIETAVSAGGDSLEAFAQVSQMSADDFARAWEEDPTTALKAFIEGLNAIEDAGGSADATLGALDINAARQKQAIMGLMQTIDMLDDNLQMSQNAWDGISDEWGSAGDAAEEASRKAEGFSGSLSILQNSVQVIGAEIANSFAPMLSNVADVVGDFAQAFTEVDDSTKQAIATFAGIAAAVGPVLMYVRALVSAGGSLSKMFTRLKGASGIVSGISTALSGVNGALLGIGAAVAMAGIAVLVSELQSAAEHAANMEKATEGLEDAVERTGSLDEYSGKLEIVGETASESAKSVDELAESMAKSTDKMNETTADAETQIRQLSNAQAIIKQYAGQTDLSAEAQGRLQWALNLVNDEFGMNLSLADAAAGSYKDQEGNVHNLVSAIDELINAKKREARVNAITSNLTEAYKDQADAADTLAAAQKDYNDQVDYYMRNAGWSREQAEAAADSSVEGQRLREAEDLYDSAVSASERYETRLAAETQAENAAADSASNLLNIMDSRKSTLFQAQLEQTGNSISGLTEDLDTLGVDVQEFSGLNEEELSRVASAYDGTAASIIDILRELGISFSGEAVSIVSNANNIQKALQNIDNVDLTETFEGLGYDMDTLSLSMAQAGISIQQLNSIGSSNLQALAEAAGGSINQLIFLIQGYNATPIVNKDGTISVDQTQLMDANENIYEWNGSQLLDKDGNVVTEQVELVDALGNFVIWNGTTLETINGEATSDFSDIIEAINAIDALKRRDGTHVTSTVETRYVSTYQSIHIPQSADSAYQRSAPASAAFLQAQSASPMMAAAQAKVASYANGVASMARSLPTLPDLASSASNLATAYRQGAVSSMSRGEGSIGNAGALMSSRNGAVTTQNVNVTIDGTGTTARIERITLELLDELERLGAI